MVVPFVVESDGRFERSYDIYSRLLKDRIIFLGDAVDHSTANSLVAQLLFLSMSDAKKPIKFYINSPGGSVPDGLAIIDTMNHIPNEVHTYCVGSCASMGAMLLSAGTKGHRYCLPHSRVMIHQVSSGARGTTADMLISMKETEKYNKLLMQMLADNCNQPVEKITKDCDRDFFMSSEEALKYGIIDKVL